MAELSFERAIDILAGTPPVLAAIVSNLPRSAQDERPSVGAWSPREVLGHLLHAETVAMGPRVLRASQQNYLRIEPASTPPPPPGGLRQMSNEWADARSANLVWLRQLTPEQRVVQRENYERLYISLERLSPLQQQLIRLRYGNGLRLVEIARILDKPEGTVRKWLARTLHQLRAIYEKTERGTHS